MALPSLAGLGNSDQPFPHDGSFCLPVPPRRSLRSDWAAPKPRGPLVQASQDKGPLSLFLSESIHKVTILLCVCLVCKTIS